MKEVKFNPGIFGGFCVKDRHGQDDSKEDN